MFGSLLFCFLTSSLVVCIQMPLVPLRRILYWMGLTELFLLSFTSRKLRDIIEHLLIPTFVDLIAFNKEFEFVVHTVEPTKRLRFSSKYPSMPYTEKKFTVMIGNQKIKMALIYEHHADRYSLYLKRKYVGKMFEFGFPYIRELFEPDEINLSVSFLKMHRLLPRMNVSRLTIKEKSINAGKLEAILTKITVHHHLRVLNKVTGRLPIHSRMNDVLQLHTHGKWMRPAQILNFAGDHAFFSNTRFQDEDIVAFLRKWLNGDFRRLTTLIVQSKNRFSVEAVTRQFETSPWDHTQRARHYPYESEISSAIAEHHLQNICDCDVGYDIRRQSGRLATFKITSNHFIFFVWFNRFPRRVVNHAVNG